MTQETLEKAYTLNEDIRKIDRVLDDNRNKRWIKVIGARNEENFYSVRFQNELAEWLKQKREQYQKELDDI